MWNERICLASAVFIARALERVQIDPDHVEIDPDHVEIGPDPVEIEPVEA